MQTARTLIATRSNVGEAASAAAEVLTEVLGGGCVIRLASDDRQWLDAIAIRCADPDEQRFVETLCENAGRQPADAGVNGAVFSSGQTLVMGEIDVEDYRLMLQSEFWPVLDRYRILSTIAVPLRGPSEIIGTLTVADFDAPTGYDDDLQQFVEDLAELVALAIDLARRTERGEDGARVWRVSTYAVLERERPYLVWANGRTYCSDERTLSALFHVIDPHGWETALTDPKEALEVFLAAFTVMGHTPDVHLT